MKVMYGTSSTNQIDVTQLCLRAADHDGKFIVPRLAHKRDRMFHLDTEDTEDTEDTDNETTRYVYLSLAGVAGVAGVAEQQQHLLRFDDQVRIAVNARRKTVCVDACANSVDVTVILTCTVNVDRNKVCVHQTDPVERRAGYVAAAVNWLTQSTFNVVLVENSGHDFLLHELAAWKEQDQFSHRFEIVTFCERDLPAAEYLRGNDSKGASEMFAIRYAYLHSRIMQKATFMIKITGRYFVPGLQTYLDQFDLAEYDCLTQSDRDRCEMVGCHVRHFPRIFDLDLRGEHCVEVVWKHRTSQFARVLVCAEFAIEPTRRGGIDQIFDTI